MLLIGIFLLALKVSSEPVEFKVTDKPVPIVINSNTTVRIYTTKEEDDAFFLFSAHCRASQVAMSLKQKIIGGGSVVSTDPALVYLDETNMGKPGVFLINTNPFPLRVLATVRRYTVTDPVPGWCTTRKGIWPKPFLGILWDDNVIKMNFSRASLWPSYMKCNEKDKFTYEIYHKYLDEAKSKEDLEDSFERAVTDFSDLEKIRSLGTRVRSLKSPVNEIVFASYPSTGSIYAVVVRYQSANITGTALYGLGHTYGCEIEQVTGHCVQSSHVISKIVLGLAVFVGLVLAFVGHRLFITSQFLFGFYFGCFFGFILLCLWSSSLGFGISFTLTVCCGLLGATLSTALWLLLGIPVLSIFLPTLELGVLAASILMFTPALNVPSLTADLYYWLVFLCVSLAVPGVLLAFTQKASILSCCVLGTFTTILPIDYFLSTNLRYIGLNVLRRATVPEFSAAVILPPLQATDLGLVACWLGLALAALVTQLLVERKKAPFPPSPFHLMRWRRELDRMEHSSEEETAPLVGNEVSLAAAEPVAAPVVGYILGYSSVATGVPVQQGNRDSPDLRETRRPRPLAAPQRGRDIFKPPSPSSVQSLPAPPYSPNSN